MQFSLDKDVISDYFYQADRINKANKKGDFFV